MKKLLKYMKEYRGRCALAPLFKMLEAAAELFVPLVMADVIDNGIAGGDRGYIISRCLILVALAVVGFSFTLCAQYFSAVSAVGFVTNVKRAAMRRILSFGYPGIDREGTAALLARMTGDITEVQNGVNLTLRLLLRSPFVVIGSAVMAFTVDAPSAVVFAVVIPVLFAVVFAVLLSTIPIYKKVRAKTEALLFTVKEHLFGVRVIRSFRAEGREKEKFDRENGELTKRSRLAGRISALLNPLTFVTVNLGILLLLGKGGLRIKSGALSVGQLVALYNYMSQILVELLKLANLVISISRSLSAASRIEEILEAPVEEETHGGDIPHDYSTALKLSDVSCSYSDGASPALSGVSLELPRGGSLGVIGPTGSGKTTLVNVISGFYPASGGIELFGVPAETLDRQALRRAVRRVPQRSVLFAGTVRENLLWADPDASDEELFRAASLASAKDFLLEKNGLDTVVGEGGSGLSGGQRQRLAIARALAGDPKFLILDDSTSSLDPATAKAVTRAVASLDGVTLITVSQRTSSVKGADLILVLDNGRQVGLGTHEELLRTCSVYREIHASQYGGASLPEYAGEEAES